MAVGPRRGPEALPVHPNPVNGEHQPLCLPEGIPQQVFQKGAFHGSAYPSPAGCCLGKTGEVWCEGELSDASKGHLLGCRNAAGEV